MSTTTETKLSILNRNIAKSDFTFIEVIRPLFYTPSSNEANLCQIIAYLKTNTRLYKIMNPGGLSPNCEHFLAVDNIYLKEDYLMKDAALSLFAIVLTSISRLSLQYAHDRFDDFNAYLSEMSEINILEANTCRT
jgi:hypothetical protein